MLSSYVLHRTHSSFLEVVCQSMKESVPTVGFRKQHLSLSLGVSTPISPPILIFAPSSCTQKAHFSTSQPHVPPPQPPPQVGAVSLIPTLACLRCRTLSFTCSPRSALLASHNRSGSPTGLPKNSQRKKDSCIRQEQPGDK